MGPTALAYGIGDTLRGCPFQQVFIHFRHIPQVAPRQLHLVVVLDGSKLRTGDVSDDDTRGAC